MVAAALLLSAAAAAAEASASATILDQLTVEQINAEGSGASWHAEMSPRFSGSSKADAYRMLGVTALYDGVDTMGGAISWAPRPHLRNKVRSLALLPPASGAVNANRLTLALPLSLLLLLRLPLLPDTACLCYSSTRSQPTEKLPDAFDSRVFWGGGDPETTAGFNCSTIVTVENQGGCGSCWAFGSSEAFSDRTCIGSEGKVDVILSPQEPTSCVGCMVKGGGLNTSCGYNGCGGGQPHQAWEFFAEDGLVDVACWPYASGNTYAHTSNPNII